jgi:hypothetical protein
MAGYYLFRYLREDENATDEMEEYSRSSKD